VWSERHSLIEGVGASKNVVPAKLRRASMNMGITRGCSQSSEPNKSTRQMNKRQKGLGEFVVSRGNTSELLETSKETLDQIALAVKMGIEMARGGAIGTRRYNGLGSRGLDLGDEVVGVVPFVGNHRLGRQLVDEIRGVLDIGDLPRRENHSLRIAQSIDRHMQLGGQTAARSTDFLTSRFFWAPAEC